MLTVNTKTYEVGGIETAAREYSCLSTDEKPVSGVGNGSILVEIDTGKVYFFDAAGSQWVEQFSFQS